jgi:hypothetical protein
METILVFVILHDLRSSQSTQWTPFFLFLGEELVRSGNEYGQVPKHVFPELYSFAKKPNLTLEAAKSSQSLIQDFHLPLSTEAYQQFLQLEEIVNNIQPTRSNDTWSYIWEDRTSHVQKLINISQAQLGFIQFLDGFGGLLVNTNTKCSFDCWHRIGLAQETY